MCSDHSLDLICYHLLTHDLHLLSLPLILLNLMTHLGAEHIDQSLISHEISQQWSFNNVIRVFAQEICLSWFHQRYKTISRRRCRLGVGSSCYSSWMLLELDNQLFLDSNATNRMLLLFKISIAKSVVNDSRCWDVEVTLFIWGFPKA